MESRDQGTIYILEVCQVALWIHEKREEKEGDLVGYSELGGCSPVCFTGSAALSHRSPWTQHAADSPGRFASRS
jgi:hypothetical protein